MKNKNILFKTTHPNIDISALVYCVFIVSGKTHQYLEIFA